MSKQTRLLELSMLNLKKSTQHLQTSFENTRELDLNDLTDAELVLLEALTARFGRTIDILLGKVLRLICDLQFIEKGTLIDVANHAEKFGIVESALQLRELKQLRNNIVHEYDDFDIAKFSKAALQEAPALFVIVDNTLRYCHDLLARL
jgi:hypothetical protein